jgi:branched-chain amino acid transport system permease protein
MPLDMLMQVFVNGLQRGGIYILVALGMTLVLSIMNIVNFAHGQFYMLGAFVVYYLAAVFHVNFFVALIVSMIVIALFGIFIERITFKKVRGQLLQGLMVSIGLGTLIETGGQIVFGSDEKGVSSPVTGTVNFAGASITAEKLMAIGVCALLTIVLYIFVFMTKLGRAIRAVAEDREAAAMQGISIDRMNALAFAIGCALAAAAGGLVAPILFVSPFIGIESMIKALAVIIMGGMGSITGCVVGGIILGLIESLGLTFLGYGANLIVFAIIVLVLLIKPTGFFGRPDAA